MKTAEPIRITSREDLQQEVQRKLNDLLSAHFNQDVGTPQFLQFLMAYFNMQTLLSEMLRVEINAMGTALEEVAGIISTLEKERETEH